jgi:predicted metal-dependent hydrolase
VPLILRRSGRARRISLRVSRLDGRVTLTLPGGVPESEAVEFARSKETWIRRHLSDRPDATLIDIGAVIPVEGRPRRIEAGTGRGVSLTGDAVAVPVDAPARRLQGFLRELARDRLAAACDRHAGVLGRPYCRLSLRDPRSRWGSCSAEGRLMFSWRLILAPPDILDYVAAHEVAHLAEMNHSPAFWEIVHRLFGPHKPTRDWLRRHGGTLHGYRF